MAGNSSGYIYQVVIGWSSLRVMGSLEVRYCPLLVFFFWSGQQQQVLPGYSLGLLGSQEERNHLALQSRGWGLEAESEVYKPSVGVGGCLGPRNPASLGLGLGEGG